MGTAGLLLAIDFSLSDEQEATFLVSVMDCSDCDSLCLDSPNSSWSIAHLKNTEKEKEATWSGRKPSFLNGIISTDIRSPGKHTTCRPTHTCSYSGAARSRILALTSLAPQPLAFLQLSRVRGPNHRLANGSQLQTFSPCLSLLCTLIAWETGVQVKKETPMALHLSN